MRTQSLRRYLMAGAALSVFVYMSGAQAETAPSNEELFRMLKANQELIRAQQQRILELEARTNRYERELGKTSAASRANTEALTKANQELDEARRAMRESQNVMATKSDLDRTKAELGTQPTTSVFRTNPVIGWKGFGEFTFMRVSATNVTAFTTSINDFGSNTFSQQTTLAENSYEPGFRFGGRYGFGNGWDGALVYTWLRNDTRMNESLAAGPNQSANLGVGNQIFSGINNGTIDGTFTYKVLYDALDLTAGYNFFAGQDLRFRAFGGLRWMRLDQKMGGTIVRTHGNLGGQQDSRNFSATADLWGIGPRLGMAGKWDIGGGFMIFGHLAASFLIGSDKGDIGFADSGFGNARTQTRTRNSNTAFTQGLDGAIGVGYMWAWSQTMNVIVKVGYRADHYFNLRGFGGSESSSSGFGSLTMHGFFFKAALTF